MTNAISGESGPRRDVLQRERGTLRRVGALRRLAEGGSNATALDSWHLARLLNGWSVDSVIAAAGGAVSRRTVYRWKHDIERLERVELGGYVAVFAVRRGKPPARVSQWEEAA